MSKIDEIDRPTDALFLLLQNAEEIEGVTKIQKLLFLMENETKFGKKYGSKTSFEFEPYKMGPFSPKVYDELELLDNMNAMETEGMDKNSTESYEFTNFNDAFNKERDNSNGLSNNRFIVTEKGEKIGKSLMDLLSKDVRKDLSKTIERYNSMSLNQLLEYVYTEYPEMTTKSEIVDQVL